MTRTDNSTTEHDTKYTTSRRGFLIGSTVAATPFSARAQTAPRNPNLDDTDAEFVRQTLAICSLSFLISKMAADKVAVPRLKEFAILEVAEQTAAWSVLTSIQSHAPPSGSISPPSEADAEQHLGPVGQQVVSKMRATDAGAVFTREYYLAETNAHQLSVSDE